MRSGSTPRRTTAAPGSQTKEVGLYKLALKPLRQLYGGTRAADFGPRCLIATAQYRVATVSGFKESDREPEQARNDGPTPKQFELLGKLGVSASTAAGYGRRQASAVIESLKAKRYTNQQRWRLKKMGYADAEIDGMNFDAASKAIEAAMQGANT